MNTIQQFASLSQNLAQTSALLNDLAHNYTSVAERTALDEAHIDLLVAQAGQLIVAAEALKLIEFGTGVPGEGVPGEEETP